MFVKNFDINSFMQGGINLVISFALGIAMVGGGAFMLFKCMDYRNNVQQIKQLDIVDAGRIHNYSPPGTVGRCFILESSKGVQLKAIGASPEALSKCEDAKAASASWENHKWVKDKSIFQLSMGVFLALFLFVTAIGYAIIPVSILVMITKNEWLYENARIFIVILALPVLIYGMSHTLGNTFNPPATTWLHEGMPVQTYNVYLTSDGKAYRAPESVYDWSETYVAQLVTKIEFNVDES